MKIDKPQLNTEMLKVKVIHIHGRPQDFFIEGGQIRGLETKVTQRGPGIEAPGESGGFAPRSRRQIMKIIHK